MRDQRGRFPCGVCKQPDVPHTQHGWPHKAHENGARHQEAIRQAKAPPAPAANCSRCNGSGNDPEVHGCTCDCCGGTGVES